MKSLKLLLSALLMLSLAACIPLYRAKEGEPTARLNLNSGGSVHICLGGTAYRLKSDKDGYAAIPVAPRLMVTSGYYASGGNMSYSCAPSVAFRPVQDQGYAASFEIRSGVCHLMVYREDNDAPSGLAMEDSLQRPACN